MSVIPYSIRSAEAPLPGCIQHECICCNGIKRFKVSYCYMSIRLLFMFGVIVRWWYMATCTECGTKERIKKREVGNNAQNAHIPFLDKWGLLAFIALCIVIGLYANYSH